MKLANLYHVVRSKATAANIKGNVSLEMHSKAQGNRLQPMAFVKFLVTKISFISFVLGIRR